MDVFDLVAKISLNTDDYERGLDNAGTKTHNFGEKIKSGLATAAKVGAAGLAVATTAAGALTKAALDSYGDYEQLAGGVETLFKESADVVMKYANNAYKTSGLSANQYMETVTSFSASLLQSLGGDTEKAAKYADTAITDMSDNANKMGTSMDMIQNAYQGFAKQNYTMLDNLKLGYGGTKEEMQRLLDDATKLSGIEYDISSYADIVDAIHTVQTEMGITGTTAKEASQTIQGSVSAAKSAWANLVAGIGDENADLDQLIANVVDSVATAGENIIPRVEKILAGIGATVEKLAPIIGEKIPPLVADILPPLLGAAASLISSVGTGILAQLPKLVPVAVQMIMTLVKGLTDSLPQIVSSAVDIILALVEGLIDALPQLIEQAPVIIGTLVTSLIQNAPRLLSAAVNLMGALVRGIINCIPNIGNAMAGIINSINNAIGDIINSALNWGKDLIDNFVSGIKSKFDSVKRTISNVAQTVKNFIGFSEPKEGPLSNFHTYAPDMMELFAKGITDNAGLIKSAFDNSLDFGPASAANIVPIGYSEAYGTTMAASAAPTAVASGVRDIIINVDGARYSDERALAERIAYEVQNIFGRRSAVFA